MTIEEQFNLIAQEYDGNRRKVYSLLDDFYESTTKLIVANIDTPRRVLDLGAGTGLLSYYWYKECPSAEYVLVDIADEMLEISKKRFAGIDRVQHKVLDYTRELPEGNFDAIISALSIHHLEDAQKEELFKRIYNKLPAGGVLANYDQFCAGTANMNKWFDLYWEQQLLASGLTERDIELWKERRKLDKECSVEAQMEMLYRCNFSEIKCLYSYHKFSVIVAIR